MNAADAALWFTIGAVVMGVAVLAIWHIRSQAVDAERWGMRLRLEDAVQDDPWRGLEDAQVRVKPLYDFDTEQPA